MSDEKNESRINVKDLPQAEQELTPEEAKEVQGGAEASIKLSGLAAGTYDVQPVMNQPEPDTDPRVRGK